MNDPEPGAKIPSLRTGSIALLAALRRCDGSGASSFGRRRRLAGLILVSAAVLSLFLAAQVSADGRIDGQLSTTLRGLAVSETEGGDIYVPDGASNQRVNRFHPDGSFVGAFGWGIVPGAATGTGTLTAGSNLVLNVHTTSGSFNMGGLGGKIITGPGIPAGTQIEPGAYVKATELVLSKNATASGTDVALSVAAGPGNIPTNERQQVTVKATGGNFKLTFISPKPGSATVSTPNISAGVTHEELQEALEGLSNIGAGNVSVTGGPGDATGTTPYLIEFKGIFADTNVRKLSASNVSLSGGSPTSVAVTTPTEGGGVVETCTTVCGYPSSEEDAFESGEGVANSRPGGMNYPDEIAVDQSTGDVYLVDERNFRVEKYDAEGHFLLMFGGEVDKTTHANVCTAADLAGGDVCEAGVTGTGASHFYKEEPQTEAGGRKSWSNAGSNSIAVGPDGTVYVGDYGRIQEFEPDGTYVGELNPGDVEPQFVTALAVDSTSGNIFERSAITKENGSVVHQVPGVREYDGTTHALVQTFDTESGSEPTHIALDESGDLFVSDLNSGEFQFRAFKPSGALYAFFSSDQITPLSTEGGKPEATGIAIGNAAGKLYATSRHPEPAHVAVIPLPEEGPPTVAKEEVSDIQATTASVHATVDPHGFDTHYHFEYVDEDSFENEGGFASPHTQSTASNDLGQIIHGYPVLAAISGLVPGTTYHFRAVAESSEGTVDGADETFASLPPVSVRNFDTQVVAPGEVTLKAELNSNGLESTYVIHYGEDTSYSDGSTEGTLAIGNEFVPREATFTGLQPNTTYHYQLIASNGYGSTETTDRTFKTEPSGVEERAAESCPNTNLREENNSLTLPDCRAYEQVSVPHKEGGFAGPYALAPGGNRALYLSSGAFAGAASDELAVMYLAQRSESGWSTRAVVGRPAGLGYQPGSGDTLNFSPELDRWIYTEKHGLNFVQQIPSPVFYSMGFADGTFLNQATPMLSSVEGGREADTQIYGQSEDLSHLFIVTTTRLLESDPRPSTNSASPGDRIYEISGAGGPNPSVSLVAEVPPGLSDSTCQMADFVQAGANSRPRKRTLLRRRIDRRLHGAARSRSRNEMRRRNDGRRAPQPIRPLRPHRRRSTNSTQCAAAIPVHVRSPMCCRRHRFAAVRRYVV